MNPNSKKFNEPIEPLMTLNRYPKEPSKDPIKQ